MIPALPLAAEEQLPHTASPGFQVEKGNMTTPNKTQLQDHLFQEASYEPGAW